MTSFAITVLGPDRPGIIARAAEALAGAGMNLEDSTMTLLRGHFAMTLICSGETGAAAVEEALTPLVASGLAVQVREVESEPDPEPGGEPWLVSVHGADRLGIVARFAAAWAEFGGNVTDLTTRLAGDLYVLLAEVDLPAGTDARALADRIAAVSTELGVEASLRPVDRDAL